MFSHWSRPQLGLATHAVQEVVHRKQNLSTRGCVILYTFRRKLVDNLLCLWRYMQARSTNGIKQVIKLELKIQTRRPKYHPSIVATCGDARREVRNIPYPPLW